MGRTDDIFRVVFVLAASLAGTAFIKTRRPFQTYPSVSQFSTGSRVGIKTSLPILSISSRTMFSILAKTRSPKGKSIYPGHDLVHKKPPGPTNDG